MSAPSEWTGRLSFSDTRVASPTRPGTGRKPSSCWSLAADVRPVK